MGKVFEYIQISNDYEQQMLSIEEFKKANNIYDSIIFIEKNKNKDREQLQSLLEMIGKDDLLIVDSINVLGKTYKNISKTWEEIINKEAKIIVLDMGLDTREYEKLGNLFLNILNHFVEKENNYRKQRQKEGYDNLQKDKDGKLLTKDGTKVVGRPRIDYPDNWIEVYNDWKESKITATKAMELLNLKRNTFYRLANKYETTVEA